MNAFLPQALKLLQKSKSLLKKQLSDAVLTKALTKLKLHQSLPRKEVNLYGLMAGVVDFLQAEIKAKSENTRFSGTLQLLKDMQNLLDCYHLVGNRVVHASQEASRAMLTAIQLMVLPSASDSKKVTTQLRDCALKIARFGAEEQRLLFQNTLEKHISTNESFFMPILSEYQVHLTTYTNP